MALTETVKQVAETVYDGMRRPFEALGLAAPHRHCLDHATGLELIEGTPVPVQTDRHLPGAIREMEREGRSAAQVIDCLYDWQYPAAGKQGLKSTHGETPIDIYLQRHPELSAALGFVRDSHWMPRQELLATLASKPWSADGEFAIVKCEEVLAATCGRRGAGFRPGGTLEGYALVPREHAEALVGISGIRWGAACCLGIPQILPDLYMAGGAQKRFQIVAAESLAAQANP